jgi:hypothetical protein
LDVDPNTDVCAGCNIFAAMHVFGTKYHGWGEWASNLVNALRMTSAEVRLIGYEATIALDKLEKEAAINGSAWDIYNNAVTPLNVTDPLTGELVVPPDNATEVRNRSIIAFCGFQSPETKQNDRRIAPDSSMTLKN